MKYIRYETIGNCLKIEFEDKLLEVTIDELDEWSQEDIEDYVSVLSTRYFLEAIIIRKFTIKEQDETHI